MDRKKREFHNLTEGRMTVDAYQREFLKLSRYAEDDVSTDAHKQEKFRWRTASWSWSMHLTLHEFTRFCNACQQRFPGWNWLELSTQGVA